MEFKRFSKDKQEQIRQFVAYAQMMGLTGKDIRSIGDKLDRIRQTEERDRNRAICAEYNCLPIGRDRRYNTKNQKHYYEKVLDSRFKLKGALGDYNFTLEWARWTVRSLKTGVKKTHDVCTEDYELGAVDWSRKIRQTMILDINAGKFKLDF